MRTEREYRIALNRDDEVIASTSESRPEWRLRPQHPRKRWSRTPHEAVLTDASNGVHCAVRRLSRFPRPRYALVAGERVLGTLDSLDLWRTRYRLISADGRSDEVHMPMFGTRFTATSRGTAVARVRVLREDVWAVLFQPGEDRPELVAALARLLYARWHSE